MGHLKVKWYHMLYPRETLAELMKITLKLLSASSSYKYNVEDILKNINFLIMDTTFQSLLTEILGEKL